MKRMIVVGALGLLAGCTSQSEIIGRTSTFGYAATPITSPIVRPSVLPQLSRPVRAVVRTEPGPAIQEAAEQPYDMAKDPYVTAVLLPPVQSDRSLEFVESKDGVARLQTSASPPVIDLADAKDAYPSLDVE